MDPTESIPSRPARTAARWALAVFAVLFVLFFFRETPLLLDPARATNAPDQFDTTRALDRLGRVLDGAPHPVDSDPLDATRARLIQEIAALGYEPQIVSQNACRGSISGSSIRCAFVQNIFFRAGPAEGPALVLTAHYDSVEASPGFGDDGIGVAVWLEVAQHLKQTPPTRPVLFLITDGEETALLGAQAFVDSKEKYGVEVGRIINLEARGVRGPAAMFETGHPNAGVVTDWSRNAPRPMSNSMMTAAYELLPNSTDLTVHLRNGSNGVNIAIADGLDFYHTNHDDLAHLDRASVQHMGDQALGATRAYLAADWGVDKGSAEIAYSDIASRLFVSLPEIFALVLLGLCFGVAAMLLVRPTREGSWQKLDWRAFALPPAVIAVSAALAWVVPFLIGLVRPEPAFWTAWPQALNMTIFTGVLVVSALGLAFLAPTSKREALYGAGWFWFLIVGLGLSIARGGFSMIFLIPGVVFVLVGGAAWVQPRYQLIAYGIASAVLALVFFPLIHLVDVMMGLGMAPAFGLIEALVVVPMLAMIGGVASGKKRMLATLGAVFAAGAVITLMMPAYSVERPLPLNFTAHYDIDEGTAALFASQRAGALPKAVRDQLQPGANPSPPGAAPNLSSRKLDPIQRSHATATLLSSTPTADGGRVVSLKVAAPGARMARIYIPADVHPTQLAHGGRTVAMKEPRNNFYVVDIVGRSADGAVLDFTLAPPAAETPERGTPAWLIQGFWTELPSDARVTADARPDTAVRIQMGDVTITTKKQAF